MAIAMANPLLYTVERCMRDSSWSGFHENIMEATDLSTV